MYLTHGSRASVEGFAHRDGRRGARGTEDHREVRGIGDSSESLVGQVRSLRRHARPAWRTRRRTTAAGRVGARKERAASAASRSSQHAVWSVLQNRASSPPGQGLFREPGAVARPGSERTAPARGPAWPCWPPPRCWPWPRPRRPRPRSGAPPSPPPTSAAASSVAATAFRPGDAAAPPSSPKTASPTTPPTTTSPCSSSAPTDGSNSQVDAAITTATAALTLVVGSTALVLADAPIIPEARIWNSSGVSLTAGTDITVKLTAPGTPNTAAMARRPSRARRRWARR